MPIRLGVCYHELGDRERAIALFQEVLQYSPHEPHANYHLALAYQAMGRSAAARVHLERSLAAWSDADPAYEPAQRARGAMALVGEESGNAA